MGEQWYIDEFVRLMAATESGSKERQLLRDVMLRGDEWGPEQDDLEELLWPSRQVCDGCDCAWIPGVRSCCDCWVDCSKCGEEMMKDNDRDERRCEACAATSRRGEQCDARQ